jgi:aryl-alcohol dehydrogenase-like predicted oxidoreductase
LRDVSALEAKDIRRTMPRFEPANYAANLRLLPAYEALAVDAGCTPAQLALAWLLHKAPHIVAIPGTTKLQHLQDNMAAADVKLSESIIERAEKLINQKTVTGGRYNAQAESEVDTEVF